jgi:glycosyltransferase involved in cell wall biosynthesis
MNNPHKVLFIHKWFSFSGGVERVHQNLSYALEKESIVSEFYVFNINTNKKAGFEKLIKNRSAVHPPENAPTLQKIIHLLEHVRKFNPTVIIAATETANLLALICAIRFPSVKIIYTRHCAFDVSDQKLSPTKIKFLYNLYSLSGGTIVGVSEDLKKQILSALFCGTKKVRFIRNAVINERVDELSITNTDNFNRSSYFVSVGRLVEQKGFDLLIEAYAQAKTRQPNLPNLIIVGEGEAEESLRHQISATKFENCIELYGYTDNPYFIIKHAQAFILSSRHEGMPTVLIEAMHLNTPVIAFDCPTGPAELIQHKQNGLLIENQNLDALASAMLDYQSLKGKHISDTVDAFKYKHVAQAYMALF